MSSRIRPAARIMLLALLSVLALLIAACGSDDGSNGEDGSNANSATSGEILLLSYNVAGLPAEISDEDPETNLPLISPRLEVYDLVLTQEDFDWWQPVLNDLDFVNYQTRLRADTTHPFASGPHPGPEAVGLDEENDRPTLLVGDGLGFLSRYAMSDIERVPWSECFGGIDTSDRGAGDCLAMKGFGVATVELAPGVEVHIYNLHGEAGATEEDQRLQAQGMDELATFMEQHSQGMPVILAGDTNLHTGGDHPDASGDDDRLIWEEFLERTGLVDVCNQVECDDPDHIDKAAIRSGGGVSIDVIERSFVRERFRDADGEDLSDHPPLEVKLRWSLDNES